MAEDRSEGGEGNLREEYFRSQPLTESARVRNELEWRLPSIVGKATNEAKMFFDFGFRDRSGREAEKYDAIVKRIPKIIEEADPGGVKKFEELSFAIAESFENPKKDLSKLLDETVDIIQDVANKNGYRISFENIPPASDLDLANRKRMFRLVLGNFSIAQMLNDTLRTTEPNPKTGGFRQEPSVIGIPDYVKGSNISIGERVSWALVKTYQIVSEFSSRYSDEQNAKALKEVIERNKY